MDLKYLPLKNPNLKDPYEAFWWLEEHPYFFYKPTNYKRFNNMPGFRESLDISYAKVNPETEEVDDDKSLNTKTEVWLEAGPWEPSQEHGYDLTGVHCHDIRLDCGGDTFEEALCAMALLVMDYEGDYPEYRHCSHCLENLPAGPTNPNEEWFCSEACKDHGSAVAVSLKEGKVRMPGEVFDCEHWDKTSKE